jgi:hypothetical protein
MRYPLIIILVIGLFGCVASELDALGNDLEKNNLTEFLYKVGGFETFKCDPLAGQEILKTWIKSLEEAEIASWPSPDNYLKLSFKNGHKYNVKTFIGGDNLKYSVLYVSGVYTGDQLVIETVCPGLKAHNKNMQSDWLSGQPLM